MNNSTDILLIYPRPSDTSPEKAPALSIFYPGAYLEEQGLNVEYVDLRFDSMGYMWGKIVNSPLVIGISTMTGTQLKEAIQIARAIKDNSPRLPIVFGGIHPSLLPQQTIQADYIDYVIEGEGEKPLLNLVLYLKGETRNPYIKGVHSKECNAYFHPESDSYLLGNDHPFPLTEKTKRYYAIANQHNHVRHLESRGCVYNCRYCYNKGFNNGTYREIPIEKWDKEVHLLREHFGDSLTHLSLGDNIGSKQRFRDVFGVLWANYLKGFLSLRCDFIDEEISSLIDPVWVDHILFGAESGSDRVLKDVLGKYKSKQVIIDCARLMNKTKVRTTYTFMCGVPGETKEDFRESLDLARIIYKIDKRSGITFFVFTPYPGCDLYTEAIKNGFKEPETLEAWERVSRTNNKYKSYNNMYFLSGLAWMGRKGHKTSQNFKGIARLKILWLEILARIRIRFKWLNCFGIENGLAQRIITKQAIHNERLQ